MKKQLLTFSGSLFLVFTVMLALSGVSVAQDAGVPLPTLSKAFKGDKCVEPADVMRRDHMNFLTHQRDETLREGIRGKKYSLQECTECHATADPEIEGGKVRTLQPFCTQCHEYAAVKLDCFACHNPKLPLPQNGSIPHDPAALKNMIASHLNKGVSQ